MEPIYLDAKKVRFANDGIALKDSTDFVQVAVGKPIHMYHPGSRDIDVFLVMHIADNGITALMRDKKTAITIPHLDAKEINALNEYYSNATSWVPVAVDTREYIEYRQEKNKLSVAGSPTITIPKATFDGLKVVVQKNDTSKVSVKDSMLLYAIDTNQEEVKPLPAIVASIDQDGFSLRVLGTNKLISVRDGYSHNNSSLASYQLVTMQPDHYTSYNRAVEVEKMLRDLGELLVLDMGSTGDTSKITGFKRAMEMLREVKYI